MKIKAKRKYLIIATSILVFPLVVGLIYNIPCKQIINVSSGDLLAYYATAFGILGSFYTYLQEKRKDKKERERRLRPNLVASINKLKNNTFEISIKNVSDSVLTHLSLYGEYMIGTLGKNDVVQKTIVYNRTDKDCRNLPFDYNICGDLSIIDVSSGYPKYLLLLCDDIEGDTWSCNFNLVNEGALVYYPNGFEIISN